MSHGMTVTNLIDDIKRRVTVPTNQNLFSTTDFIEFLNDEMFTNIVPFIMAAREEYFVTYEDAALVANQDAYNIPEEAIGAKVRDIWLVDSAGNIENVPQLSLEEVSNTTAYDSTFGFYPRGNKIVLVPTPTGTGKTLRIHYYRRPNRLAYTTSGGYVTAIDTGTNTLTLSSVPTSWTTGTKVDIQSDSLHYDLVFDNESLTGVAGTNVTIADVTGIALGDYVYAHGYSAIPMLPADVHPILAQAAAVKCLEALGDHEAYQVAERKYQMMLQNLSKLIEPRVDGASKKIVNLDGPFTSRRSRKGPNWR